jgi:hypothetical protein
MKIFLLIFVTCLSLNSGAQDDLMALADSNNTRQYALSAFKGLRIINGQSVQTMGRKNLDFVISHRFDRVNRGGYEFFGLDAAVTRLGLEYGITNDFTVGIGRSSYLKTYDFFGKLRFLKQTTGNETPFTATGFYSLNLRTQRLIPPDKLSTTDKITHTTQLLLARRFSSAFSMQLSPTYLYRNRPETTGDKKGVFATGIATRYKLNKRLSLNTEYFYVFPDQINPIYKNCLSLGFDIETGGHVFQLHFTNSYGMTERYFITETTDNWAEGDIHFGFNISRTFAIGKRKSTAQTW